MNIFILSIDPLEAAAMQCDKHVNKMLLESVQLLCNGVSSTLAQDPSALALRRGKGMYRRAHENHPCAVWAVATAANWTWLLNHAWALLEEYKFRFRKQEHACEEMLTWLDQHADTIRSSLKNPEWFPTPFVLAMPEEYKTDNPVAAYRAYYKSKLFARWEKGRPKPDWYTNG